MLLVWMAMAAAEAGGCPGGFPALRAAVEVSAEAGFQCAGALDGEARRDFILRRAYALAGPETAARHLGMLRGKPYLGDPGFVAALAIARRAAVADGRELMLAAARRNPSLALREWPSYSDLSYGAEVFAEAALQAPDEAVGLSARLPAVRAALRESPALRALAEIAGDAALKPIERERKALFHRAPAMARLDDAGFFPALADLRMKTREAREAAPLDRALERYAQMLFRWWEDRNPALGRLSAAQLYLLLGYGRAEEDDRLFGVIFDRLLLPRMRLAGGGARLPAIRTRAFLAAAAEHDRLGAFLAAGGGSTLETAFQGIETLDDALAAGEVLDAVQSAEVRSRIRRLLEAEYRPGAVFVGLLLAKLGHPDYARFYAPAGTLETVGLVDASGRCIERHVFHPDDDGVESFESFRSRYVDDPAWTWEDRGSYVRVSGGAVEIFANKPVGDGQAEISRVLAERGATVTVFVHRGHSYHVEKSLAYLPASARLVFLGSCRGLGVTAEVIARAPQAQVIVTRGVGTAGVNDPLLKAIHEELRKGARGIDWVAFWAAQERRYGRNAVFADYVPPYRNGAAQLVGAYFAVLMAR